MVNNEQDDEQLLSLKKMHDIYEQMKYSVCKVFAGHEPPGTGFLCEIPVKELNKVFHV